MTITITHERAHVVLDRAKARAHLPYGYGGAIATTDVVANCKITISGHGDAKFDNFNLSASPLPIF